MEEEDETQSLQSQGDSLSPSAPLSPPILPTSDVTVASVSKPPLASQSPSLALVVHTPSVTGGGGISGNRNGRSGGGGRDDCWSEEATKVLIDAWGDRFSEPGKGTLKQQQWKEVAEIVNDSRQCKYPKTDIQCKNRIDTLKKKYKTEKAKLSPSAWRFFDRLDVLIGPVMKKPASGAVKSGPLNPYLSLTGSKYTESSLDNDDDEDDDDEAGDWGFVARTRPRVEEVDLSDGSMCKELARAILKLGEVYERIEGTKQKMMIELEKQRMEVVKELELQKMNMLMEMQLDLEKSKNRKRVDGSGKKL